MNSELPRPFYDNLIDEVTSFVPHWAQKIEPYVGSPIELQFGVAFLAISLFRNDPVLFMHPGYQARDANWFLQPQAQIRNYRVDFLVGGFPSGPQVVVECDGHEFHEKTKEQAQRDKRRDRRLQSVGYKVFRFTGAEIYAAPFICAGEVWSELMRTAVKI